MWHNIMQRIENVEAHDDMMWIKKQQIILSFFICDGSFLTCA